jgi:hypothetical protein
MKILAEKIAKQDQYIRKRKVPYQYDVNEYSLDQQSKTKVRCTLKIITRLKSHFDQQKLSTLSDLLEINKDQH